MLINGTKAYQLALPALDGCARLLSRHTSIAALIGSGSILSKESCPLSSPSTFEKHSIVPLHDGCKVAGNFWSSILLVSKYYSLSLARQILQILTSECMKFAWQADALKIGTCSDSYISYCLKCVCIQHRLTLTPSRGWRVIQGAWGFIVGPRQEDGLSNVESHFQLLPMGHILQSPAFDEDEFNSRPVHENQWVQTHYSLGVQSMLLRSTRLAHWLLLLPLYFKLTGKGCILVEERIWHSINSPKSNELWLPCMVLQVWVRICMSNERNSE